jgi:hypothetical protein
MDDFLDFIMPLVVILGGVGLGIFLIFGAPLLLFGDRRVPDIKHNAERVFNANGFDVVGYQGYQLGIFATPGGCVWYTLKKGDITYEACLSRWGDEYHIYSLKALDAIKP